MSGLGKGGRAKKYYRKGGPVYTSGNQAYRRMEAARKRRMRPRTNQLGYVRTGGFYGRYRGLDPEFKFLDTNLSFLFDVTAECSTTAATGNMHIVPEGDGPSAREGRNINITSIHLKGEVTFTPGGSATAGTTLYLFLILDTQCNGANPGITDVFTSNDPRRMMLNLANSERFRVIKKWTWSMYSQAGVTTAYNNVVRHMEWYKKCDIRITYDATATTGAVATTRTNNVFLAFGSSVSDDTGSFEGVARIRFTG